MPLFLTDEEFSRCSNDAVLVAEKADAFIRSLLSELETVKAKADASDITAEQNCLLIEEKYLSVAAEFSNLESHHAQLQSRLVVTLSELDDVQTLKKQLESQSVEKDGELERFRTEVNELQKSKRQLIHVVEHKDSELSEKNATIKNYLDKILSLSENAAQKEARLSEVQAELVRSQAICSRLTQEKELIHRHNTLLNDELNSKVDSFNELRRKNSDLEADMASKLIDAERRYSECSKSLHWNKDRVTELETKMKTLHEDFCLAKDAAGANEDRLSAELSTVNKLNELYKESSEEWSKKAGELEGVVQAMELHLRQVENDYKARLEKEECDRIQLEKDADDLKAKLERCQAEVENLKKKNVLAVAPLNIFSTDTWLQSFDTDNDKIEEENLLVPKIPVGVSGTSFAASLLRDGWTLVKMYEKYQEAVDGLRHEQLGRKEAETVLQRVLYELEEKAEAILDERAEHEKMVEAYSMINQKLQDSLSEKENMEKTIRELKAELKRQERDLYFAQKEVGDLQKQVTVLLKECRDVQLRCGGSDRFDDATNITMLGYVQTETEDVISEHFLTFKDINGLVEQNVQLRSTVRSLSDQIDKREREFKGNLDMELRKYTEEAASKVAAVLQRAEEQERMIESLHASVVMYKKLYEEEHNLRSSETHTSEAPSEGRGISLRPLIDSSQEATKNAQEQALGRVRCLEEELTKYRTEIILLKSERDKLILEANFARDRLDSMEKELQHQKAEAGGILARNVEFSQLVVDYQRKLRESAESLRSAEELSRKLSLEVSAVKQEKEIVLNAEKRASDEVYSLSQRVHRLQASLETLQSAEENREEARAAERQKLEEYIEKLEREWAEAKKELIQERENARALTTFTSDREQTMSNAMRQVEELRNELANAVHAHMVAESRAAVAEAKLSDFEKEIKSTCKVVTVDSRSTPSDMSNTDAVAEVVTARDKIERLKEEVQASKSHMQQYKSIAQVNEGALKQVELAHENFKIEVENLKKSLEAEVVSLRERVTELEHESSFKSAQLSSLVAEKEEILASTMDEIKNLKEEILIKTSQISTMEIHISSLKEDLDKENQRWRAAQNNYERQVILQSETIQELTKTSQALAVLQEESLELCKLVDTLKKENCELKGKWEVEKTMLEESKSEAEKKYNEINEQNKLLHSRLEAFHIQRAEKERKLAGLSSESTSADVGGESDLQIVINYLRRQKEIVETELSLLRKEKLRLQSQLEKALKDAETACALLESERAKSRSLFTEEEMKSLQLQVREMNLLRESNMQLREENKHNFEECQKLRAIAEKARMDLENSNNKIKEKDIEVAACKKEIEVLNVETDHLQQRVSELLERCKNVDVEDYNRMKDTVQELQDKLKEKDSQLEETIKLATSRLEQDLLSCKQELADRENRINNILQVESNLRMQIDKGRQTINSYKKKVENLSKGRDTLLKEKEDFSKENQALSRQKEEIIKENQDLLRQLEEIKLAKRSTGDTTGEKGMKEEKDTRIQTLEKILERQKEDLKKEREDNRMERARRLKTEKAIKDSYTNVGQEKNKIVTELEKHKQALKRLSDEFEKLKNADENLPEGTNVVQLLSGPTMDDLGVAYVSAVENFEKEANLVFIEFAARPIQSETPSADSSAGPAIPVQPSTVVSSLPPVTSSMPDKVVEESEKRTSVPKTNIETRKLARKLVRPRLVKPEEPQGGIEMSEAEGSQTGGKYVPSSGVEDPIQLAVSSQPLARKRLAPSSALELREESAMVGETSSEAAVSMGKKAKATDPSQDVTEGQTMASEEFLETHSVPEESAKLPQGLNEDVNEGEREDAGVIMKIDDSEEKDNIDGKTQVEPEDEKINTVEENLDQSMRADTVPDDQQRDGPDSQQLTLDSVSDKEEGELLPDVADLEGGSDASNLVENQETEGQAGATPEPSSPSRIDDEILEAGEINTPEYQNDDKGDEVTVEETAEGSEKSNDGNEPMSTDGDQAADPAAIASENASTSVAVHTTTAKPPPATASSSITAETEEVSQVSPVTSTTINLMERAKERAELRRFSIRGRGRLPTRGRVPPPPRGGRGGRRAPGNI